MQLPRLALLITTLLAGAHACQCTNGTPDTDSTVACCSSLHGALQNGNNCQASTISEKLSNFRRCCESKGFTSDCDCPTCREEDAEAETKAAGEERLVAVKF